MLKAFVKSHKKITILLFIIIAGIVYFTWFRSKIIIIEHMSEINGDIIDQVCLVKNPPFTSVGFKSLIEDFNESNNTTRTKIKRLFVKDRKHMPFAAFFLHENFSYNSERASRDDLYNMDYLGHSISYVDSNGVSQNDIYIYIGDIDYYSF